MTDHGPACPGCQVEMSYIGQITKKGHPQDGQHLYFCHTPGCLKKVVTEERYECKDEVPVVP